MSGSMAGGLCISQMLPHDKNTPKPGFRNMGVAQLCDSGSGAHVKLDQMSSGLRSSQGLPGAGGTSLSSAHSTAVDERTQFLIGCRQEASIPCHMGLFTGPLDVSSWPGNCLFPPALISCTNALTDTPRLMFDQIPGFPVRICQAVSQSGCTGYIPTCNV